MKAPAETIRSQEPTVLNVLPAKRRPACTVGLDLRTVGQAAAVAVDRKGRVLAWALVSGEGGQAALSEHAIKQLKIKPLALRVLIGAQTAQVGVFAGVGAPEAEQISDTLLNEGYSPIDKPAIAALCTTPGTWLVACCEEGALHQLALALSELAGVEPVFIVDQLLLAKQLETGSAAVECGTTGFSVVAMPWDSAPFVRSLPSFTDIDEMVSECQRTLAMARVKEPVRLLGAAREALSKSLDRDGFEAHQAPLPRRDSHTLPAGLELAWRLATDKQPPLLGSPVLERRRQSVRWAQRTARIGIVLGLSGMTLFVAGGAAWWIYRAQNHAFKAQLPEVETQLQLLNKSSLLAKEVERLRTQLAGQSLPWPRLAKTLADLAEQSPASVGWERLSITEGALDLRVSAAGSAPFNELELMRRVLDRSAEIFNLAWQAPVTPAPGNATIQTFTARVRNPLADTAKAAP